jgi:hypothetical protein
LRKTTPRRERAFDLEEVLASRDADYGVPVTGQHGPALNKLAFSGILRRFRRTRLKSSELDGRWLDDQIGASPPAAQRCRRRRSATIDPGLAPVLA